MLLQINKSIHVYLEESNNKNYDAENYKTSENILEGILYEKLEIN